MDLHKIFDKIIVSRHGDILESHMKTVDIIGTICPKQYYKISEKNLYKTDFNTNIKCLTNTNIISNINTTKINNISDKWINNNNINNNINNNSNILGDNGVLELELDTLNIPLVETLDVNLSFYSAKLLKENDVVIFDIENVMPITIVSIGKNYVDHFLLNKNKGGGCYLEYHNTPHFHMPLNEEANGCLILGKIIDNVCHLSAFKIPFGFAIYTPPNVIHCDGYLVGEYLVVYTITDKYSTVLLQNNGSPVNVKIKNEI